MIVIRLYRSAETRESSQPRSRPNFYAMHTLLNWSGLMYVEFDAVILLVSLYTRSPGYRIFSYSRRLLASLQWTWCNNTVIPECLSLFSHERGNLHKHKFCSMHRSRPRPLFGSARLCNNVFRLFFTNLSSTVYKVPTKPHCNNLICVTMIRSASALIWLNYNWDKRCKKHTLNFDLISSMLFFFKYLLLEHEPRGYFPRG